VLGVYESIMSGMRGNDIYVCAGSTDSIKLLDYVQIDFCCPAQVFEYVAENYFLYTVIVPGPGESFKI